MSKKQKYTLEEIELYHYFHWNQIDECPASSLSDPSAFHTTCKILDVKYYSIQRMTVLFEYI